MSDEQPRLGDQVKEQHGRWFMAPHRLYWSILLCSELSPAELKVSLYIFGLTAPLFGTFQASASEIAGHCGLSRRSVLRALSSLAAKDRLRICAPDSQDQEHSRRSPALRKLVADPGRWGGREAEDVQGLIGDSGVTSDSPVTDEKVKADFSTGLSNGDSSVTDGKVKPVNNPVENPGDNSVTSDAGVTEEGVKGDSSVTSSGDSPVTDEQVKCLYSRAGGRVPEESFPEEKAAAKDRQSYFLEGNAGSTRRLVETTQGRLRSELARAWAEQFGTVPARTVLDKISGAALKDGWAGWLFALAVACRQPTKPEGFAVTIAGQEEDIRAWIASTIKAQQQEHRRAERERRELIGPGKAYSEAEDLVFAPWPAWVTGTGAVPDPGQIASRLEETGGKGKAA